MNILILGRGKTGSLVAEVARHRRHEVRIAGAAENAAGAALSAENLREIDAVIDFTTPHCVMANSEACAAAGKNKKHCRGNIPVAAKTANHIDSRTRPFGRTPGPA